MAASGKRKNKRVEFRTTVSAYFSNTSYEECKLKDLSMGGLFVYGITSQEEGDVCDLVLRLTGTSEDIKVQVRGEVVRAAPEGAGIKFQEIDIDSLAHLKNILYYNSFDLNQLDEEDLAWIPPRDH